MHFTLAHFVLCFTLKDDAQILPSFLTEFGNTGEKIHLLENRIWQISFAPHHTESALWPIRPSDHKWLRKNGNKL